jgi:hypothetical protein
VDVSEGGQATQGPHLGPSCGWCVVQRLGQRLGQQYYSHRHWGATGGVGAVVGVCWRARGMVKTSTKPTNRATEQPQTSQPQVRHAEAAEPRELRAGALRRGRAGRDHAARPQPRRGRATAKVRACVYRRFTLQCIYNRFV